MELSNVSDIITVQLSSSFGILSFILVTNAYTVGQYFILNFSKKDTSQSKERIDGKVKVSVKDNGTGIEP